MQQITILIKPASGICNAVCEYCFYEDTMRHRKQINHGYMSDLEIEAILKNTLAVKKYERVLFYFQGGEPLVVGIDFYEKFIDKAKRLQQHVEVEYAIQTNGILLDEAYCKLFKKNNFLVGISLDGIKKTNDSHRFLANKATGSFDTVLKKIELLEKYNISYNILSVLSKKLALHAQEIYAFYRKKDFKYIQFIPCLPSIDNGLDDLYSCTPQLYKNFYTVIFKQWLKDLKKGQYISIRLFEDILLMFNKQKPMQCGMLGKCQKQCIIESDGSVYPCDFYVLDEYMIGNIKEKSIDDLMNDTLVNEFIDDRKCNLLCEKCKFKNICNGGCRRQRITFLDETYCGMKEIFELFYTNYKTIHKYLRTITQNERDDL